jgi:anhydro-N-acetylmuramic acid kinase
LVPVGDELLFPEYDACLNLGGIANVSYRKGDRRQGFDLAPCNIVLNQVVAREGLKYDPEGRMARSGKADALLLSELKKWDWLKLDRPKSLGRERIEAELQPLINAYPGSISDLLASLVEFIAEEISMGLRDLKSGARVLLSGGGTHNLFLIETLTKKSNLQFHCPLAQTVDFKEALIFAFLAYLYSINKVNVLASVTGSQSDHIGGALYRY